MKEASSTIYPRYANAYKHCADISLKRIYRSRDVLDIELAGFRIISTLLELMIDAVRSPERHIRKLLINRVSGQYNIKKRLHSTKEYRRYWITSPE